MRPAPLLLCLVLASSRLDAQDPTPAPADIVGSWSGSAVHAGESQPFGVHFDAAENGELGVKMTVPALGLWDLPFAKARLEPGGVRIGSTFALKYDPAARTLAGTLPEALVPVYRIPVTLTRGTLARPPEAPASAPAASPIWTFDAGAPIWGGVGVARGVVYVGADDGRLVALDGRTGKERWTFRARGAIRARPLVEDGALYVPSDDGFLYRLDAASGALRWKVPIEGVPVERIPIGQPKSRFERNASGAATDGRRLYVGTHDGHVLALDPRDGTRYWAFKAGDTVLATPAVHGGRVYFGSFDGHVYAVAADTGALAWKHDTRGAVVSTPAVHEGRVIVGSRSYDLLALDARTGAPLWTRYIWFSWVESSAVVRDGVAYVGSSDAARLYAIDTRTGRSVWELPTGGWPWGQPAVTAHRVFMGSAGDAQYVVKHEGSFIGVDRRSGRIAWRFAAAPPEGKGQSGFVGSPAVADGHVFVGGLDGRVYAFAQ